MYKHTHIQCTYTLYMCIYYTIIIIYMYKHTHIQCTYTLYMCIYYNVYIHVHVCTFKYIHVCNYYLFLELAIIFSSSLAHRVVNSRKYNKLQQVAKRLNSQFNSMLFTRFYISFNAKF